MAVLLTEAKLKLEVGASLEGEVLASIQAILDTFEAQGEDQRASLAASKDAMDIATALFTGQSANLNTLVARTNINKALSIGLGSLLVDSRGGSDTDQSTYNDQARSIRPRIYDKRTGKLWSSDHIQGQTNSTNKSLRHHIMSADAGQITVAYQSTATSRTYEMAEFFYPLAKSPTDATPIPAHVSFTGFQSDGTYLNYYNMVTVRAEPFTSLVTVAGGSVNKPRGQFVYYDRQRKTLIWLGYSGSSNLASSEPPANSPTVEMFANGVVQVVAGITGWKGFVDYVQANPTRFVRVLGPLISSSTAWSASYASQVYLNPDIGFPTNRPTHQNAYQNTASVNSANYFAQVSQQYLFGPDGSLSWSNGMTDPFGIELTGEAWLNAGGQSVPMWVIELDGSVNLYRIYFHINFSKDPWAASTTSADSRPIVEGYDFALVDHTGAVVSAGEVLADPAFRRMSNAVRDAVGRSLGVVMPLGIIMDDNVVQTLTTSASNRGSTAVTTNTVNPASGAYVVITHPKLIR